MEGYPLSYSIWDQNICLLFRSVSCIVVSINAGYTRVHFMHLGPKIFGVDLTFCWRSGVIFFCKIGFLA